MLYTVYDEAHILELLSFNLEASGFRVVTATTGEDALAVCQRERPAMVLLDIMLPGIDGMEVCRRMKGQSTTADIPIIMLTAKGDEVDKILGLELGADDYITKP
ncbi:MAG: response regulator, partial [Bacteroidaceae bacterium]|nr:response regulator [Bacteroidaceae bacterium]